MTRLERQYRETVGRYPTHGAAIDAEDIAPDATVRAVRRAAKPRTKLEQRTKAQRQAANAGKPGETRLRDWLAVEAKAAGLRLNTVKGYHSAGLYRNRIEVRRVNHAVQWVTPIAGAPRVTVYPGRGYDRNGKRKATALRPVVVLRKGGAA